MGRRRSSITEDPFELGARLPWCLSLATAFLAYVLLHAYAVSDPSVVTDPKEAIKVMLPNAASRVAELAQYFLPARFPVGPLASALRDAKRSASVLVRSKRHARQARPLFDQLTASQARSPQT